MSEEKKPRNGIESDIVVMFDACFRAGIEFEDRIPLSRCDTVVYEMALKFGRADIVVFHLDGTCSVIEVKDGTKGYNHVVSGIGQACLYATQIAIKNEAVKAVRKCLMWSSTGNLVLDSVIEAACRDSKTIPLPWPSLKKMIEVAYAKIE